MKNYKENYDYYNVEKVDSIKQLLESAADMLVIKPLLNIKKIKTLNVLLTITFWKMFIVWVLLYFLST